MRCPSCDHHCEEHRTPSLKRRRAPPPVSFARCINPDCPKVNEWREMDGKPAPFQILQRSNGDWRFPKGRA